MPFADQLINESTVQDLIGSLGTVVPDLGLPALHRAAPLIETLGLRERADMLRDALLNDLPVDYASLAGTIRAAGEDAAFRGWLIWPVTSAIAVKAVAEGTHGAFDDAMALLAELTGRLSAEFAIRTLLRHDLDRALELVLGWTASDDVDVRRLASEGTRPYLPWSMRVPEITARPGATIPVLEALYRDDAEYVRRSVANHLNDLSRDAPALVVDTARRWLAEPDVNTARLVRHALRTLVKKGDVQALELLGFGPVTVDVAGPVLGSASIGFGHGIGFSAVLHNRGDEPARVAIDYTVYHRKANGGQTGKTFKLATRTLEPDEEFKVGREHSFRAITTRRYHPGMHAISLQVNGVESARAEFELLPESEVLPPERR
ncbi:DNA alkylation repair protein [Arthrobacter sp. AQ5-05]|uniref:DNA alkylation repair protein n=1 Tax=Arthrobacter sp. AQ5-05 TaxID=2184581 RepID=UPI000DCC1271|nr:DNA alkylation repair protein [Arthrobacter sp. AQ5-05]RAX49001.1 DNA alkylation repair protein [Arthrobacter sp. AQ5-05]